MKKNYVFRTAMCLGVAVMLTLCGASGTYAKYTGTIQGTEDKARVAKFDFIFGKNDTDNVKYSESQSYTVDIFNTVYDSTDGNEESDIDKKIGEVIIAPGSWGYVPLYIENASEVTITASFESTISYSSDIPLKYGVFYGAAAPTKDNLDVCTNVDADSLDDDLNAKFAGNIVSVANSGNKKQGYLIWYWPFIGDDGVDTTLGVGGTANVSVTIDCTATQVD